MAETAGQLVLYNDAFAQDVIASGPYSNTTPNFDFDDTKINPQELGKLIISLQDEIKIIKLQLENLPGYQIGMNLNS